MEHLKKAISQIETRVWLSALLAQAVALAAGWALYNYTIVPNHLVVAAFAGLCLAGSYAVAWLAGRLASKPLEAFGDAILHISPGAEAAAAPRTEQLRVGREYVSQMVYQLYQIASLQDNKQLAEHKREATQASNILTHLPLPVLVFNKQQVVTFANDMAITYSGIESAQLFGKPIFDSVDLEFTTEFTLENWIADCQANKATDAAYWRRVRLKLPGESGQIRQCDMAGYYNRDNPSGIEFIVTIFDRSDEYAADDDSLSFIALAVHELRTPLTLMRGLIEVFEEELESKLDAELQTYMQRLRGSAKQLSAFVTNILNVAKIEGNQLTIKLAEESWPDIIRHAGGDMEARAKSLGIDIKYEIEDALPTVAADQLTAYEVVSNLLDNALKYSGDKPPADQPNKVITVSSHKSKDGLVETTVTDQGVGIPTNVLPSLFEKFHRNHRTRQSVSGTGLGLYLAKAIVNAHGGDIWVKSKEGQGTTVGFTLKPYAQLADEQKTGNNKDAMVRTAHGWIKNHSLYRR